jgi:hypothetical protein
MLTILGGTLSRSVYDRSLSVQASRKAERASAAKRRQGDASKVDARGGTLHVPRATIADGANGAPSNEDVHGSQTIPAGGDDRFQHGTDR